MVDPYLLIQTDGNMVVYNLNGDQVWNSKTNGVNRGTKLELTNRGNLILSELDGDKVIWESGKFCTGKNFKHFRNLLCKQTHAAFFLGKEMQHEFVTEFVFVSDGCGLG